MEFNELIAELRASSENLPNESADRSLLSSVYCNKACKAIDKVAECAEYDNVITGLWLLVAHFAEQLRYLKPVPALSELCYKLFRQCAKSVLNIQWQNLEEDSSVRQNFLISLATLHAKLIPFDFPRFRLLESLTESPWTNPTLAKVMGGEVEDADREEVRSYIEKEDPIILQLRVDMMLKENCEEYALNLCNSCLTHPELQTDLSIRKIQLSLLYKLGHEDKLQEECQKLSIHDALRIIKQLQTSEPHRQLCTVLSQTFMVQNWIRPSDLEANKELLRLWIRQQLLVDREQDQFKDSVWAMAKLSQSTEQIVIFIDVLREECGDTYLQLYVDMCIFAINVDKGQMETSIKEDNLVAAVARRSDMASVCAKLSCLCHHTSLKVARICALTSFALRPSDQSFAKIGTFYGQGGGCCKKCGVEKNHEPGKVNPATLYEVERLLNMLRPDYLNPDNSFVNIQSLCRRFLHESLKIAEQRKQQESVVSVLSANVPDGKKKITPANKPTNLFEALLPTDVQNTQLLLNRMRLQNIPTQQTHLQTSQVTHQSSANRQNLLPQTRQQYVFDAEKVKNSLPYGVPLEQQHQYFINKHEKELEQKRKNFQKKKEGKALGPPLFNPPVQQNTRQDNIKQCIQQQQNVQLTQLIQCALQKDPNALQKLTQNASPEMVRAVLETLKSHSLLKPPTSQQQQQPTLSQPLPTVSTLLKPAAQSQQQQPSEQIREQPPPRRYPRLYAQPIIVSTASSIVSITPGAQVTSTSLASSRGVNNLSTPYINVISTMTQSQKQKADSLLQSRTQAEGIRQFMQMQQKVSEMQQTSRSAAPVNNTSTLSSNVTVPPNMQRVKTTVELAQQAAIAKQQGKPLGYQLNQAQGYTSHSSQPLSKSSQQQFISSPNNLSQTQKQQPLNPGYSVTSFNASSNVASQNVVLPSSDELSGSIIGVDDKIIKELLQDSGILANTFPDIDVDTIGEDKTRKLSESSMSQLNVSSQQTFDCTRRQYSTNVSGGKQSLPQSAQPNVRSNQVHNSQPVNLYLQQPPATSKNIIMPSSSTHPPTFPKMSLPYSGSDKASIMSEDNKPVLLAKGTLATSNPVIAQFEVKPTVDQLREQMKREDIDGEVCMDSANNATYRCIICSLAFETLDFLREHVRNVCKPGLQSSSVYNSKIKQDRANSAKAGLETTTVFQCLRCFELCVSDAGIKQHRLTCKRLPTVPSDIKKAAPVKSRAPPKSAKSTHKKEMKDNSYVSDMPLPFPYPSLNAEAVLKSLTMAGKSTIVPMNNGNTRTQEVSLTPKQQTTQVSSAPVNNSSNNFTSTSNLMSSQPTVTMSTSSYRPPNVCPPAISSFTSNPATTIIVHVSSSNMINTNCLSLSAVSRSGMPSPANATPVSGYTHANNVINENVRSVDSSNFRNSNNTNGVNVTWASSTRAVAQISPTATTSTFPGVNNSFTSLPTCSSNAGQMTQSVPSQSNKHSPAPGLPQPAIKAAQPQNAIAPAVPKKIQRKPKPLPAPSFTEISGSGGSKFCKCNLCSQTLCSLESFVVHWQECATKNKALLKRRASREKPLNAKPLTQEDIENLSGVIAFVASGGGDMENVHFDRGELSENELLFLEDPCEEENRKSAPVSSNFISESDIDGSNSMASRRSDEENFSEATTEKDSEEDYRSRKTGSRCDNKDTSRQDKQTKGKERKLSKSCQKSTDREKDMGESAGETSPSSASEVESEGSSLSCKLCKTSYENKRILLQHFAGKHLKPYSVKSLSGKTTYTCHLCHKTFPIFMHYMQHVPDHSVTIYEKMRAYIARKKANTNHHALSHGDSKNNSLNNSLVKALKSKRAAKKSALDKIKREILSSSTETVREKLSLSKRRRSNMFTSSEEDYSSDVSQLKTNSECPADTNMLSRSHDRLCKPVTFDETTSSTERSDSRLSNQNDEDYIVSDDSDSDYKAPPSTRSKRSQLWKRKKHLSESDSWSDNTNVIRSQRSRRRSPDISGFESDSNLISMKFLEQNDGSLVVAADLESSKITEANSSTTIEQPEEHKVVKTIFVRSRNRQEKERLQHCDLQPSLLLKNLTAEDIEKAASSRTSKWSGEKDNSKCTLNAGASVGITKKPSSFLDSFLSYLNRYPTCVEKLSAPAEGLAPGSNSSTASTEPGSCVDTDASTISYVASMDKENSEDAASFDANVIPAPAADVKTILAKFPTRRCSVNLGKKLDPTALAQSPEIIELQEDSGKKSNLGDVKVFLHRIELPDKGLNPYPSSTSTIEKTDVGVFERKENELFLQDLSISKDSEPKGSVKPDDAQRELSDVSNESCTIVSVENIDKAEACLKEPISKDLESQTEDLLGEPVESKLELSSLKSLDCLEGNKDDTILIETNSNDGQQLSCYILENNVESEDLYVVKESSDPEMDETEEKAIKPSLETKRPISIAVAEQKYHQAETQKEDTSLFSSAPVVKDCIENVSQEKNELVGNSNSSEINCVKNCPENMSNQENIDNFNSTDIQANQNCLENISYLENVAVIDNSNSSEIQTAQKSPENISYPANAAVIDNSNSSEIQTAQKSPENISYPANVAIIDNSNSSEIKTPQNVPENISNHENVAITDYFNSTKIQTDQSFPENISHHDDVIVIYNSNSSEIKTAQNFPENISNHENVAITDNFNSREIQTAQNCPENHENVAIIDDSNFSENQTAQKSPENINFQENVMIDNAITSDIQTIYNCPEEISCQKNVTIIDHANSSKIKTIQSCPENIDNLENVATGDNSYSSEIQTIQNCATNIGYQENVAIRDNSSSSKIETIQNFPENITCGESVGIEDNSNPLVSETAQESQENIHYHDIVTITDNATSSEIQSIQNSPDNSNYQESVAIVDNSNSCEIQTKQECLENSYRANIPIVCTNTLVEESSLEFTGNTTDRVIPLIDDQPNCSDIHTHLPLTDKDASLEKSCPSKIQVMDTCLFDHSSGCPLKLPHLENALHAQNENLMTLDTNISQNLASNSEIAAVAMTSEHCLQTVKENSMDECNETNSMDECNETNSLDVHHERNTSENIFTSTALDASEKVGVEDLDVAKDEPGADMMESEIKESFGTAVDTEEAGNSTQQPGSLESQPENTVILQDLSLSKSVGVKAVLSFEPCENITGGIATAVIANELESIEKFNMKRPEKTQLIPVSVSEAQDNVPASIIPDTIRDSSSNGDSENCTTLKMCTSNIDKTREVEENLRKSARIKTKERKKCLTKRVLASASDDDTSTELTPVLSSVSEAQNVISASIIPDTIGDANSNGDSENCSTSKMCTSNIHFDKTGIVKENLRKSDKTKTKDRKKCLMKSRVRDPNFSLAAFIAKRLFTSAPDDGTSKSNAESSSDDENTIESDKSSDGCALGDTCNVVKALCQAESGAIQDVTRKEVGLLDSDSTIANSAENSELKGAENSELKGEITPVERWSSLGLVDYSSSDEDKEVVDEKDSNLHIPETILEKNQIPKVVISPCTNESKHLDFSNKETTVSDDMFFLRSITCSDSESSHHGKEEDVKLADRQKNDNERAGREEEVNLLDHKQTAFAKTYHFDTYYNTREDLTIEPVVSDKAVSPCPSPSICETEKSPVDAPGVPVVKDSISRCESSSFLQCDSSHQVKNCQETKERTNNVHTDDRLHPILGDCLKELNLEVNSERRVLEDATSIQMNCTLDEVKKAETELNSHSYSDEVRLLSPFDYNPDGCVYQQQNSRLEEDTKCTLVQLRVMDDGRGCAVDNLNHSLPYNECLVATEMGVETKAAELKHITNRKDECFEKTNLASEQVSLLTSAGLDEIETCKYEAATHGFVNVENNSSNSMNICSHDEYPMSGEQISHANPSLDLNVTKYEVKAATNEDNTDAHDTEESISRTTEKIQSDQHGITSETESKPMPPCTDKSCRENVKDKKVDSEPILEKDNKPVLDKKVRPVFEKDDKLVLEKDDKPVLAKDDKRVLETDHKPILDKKDKPVLEKDDPDDLDDFDLVIEEDKSSRKIVPYRAPVKKKETHGSKTVSKIDYTTSTKSSRKDAGKHFTNAFNSIKKQLEKFEPVKVEMPPRKPLSGARSLKKVSQEQFVWDDEDEDDSKHHHAKNLVKSERTKNSYALFEAVKRKRNASLEKSERSPFKWDLDDGTAEKTLIVNQENNSDSQSDMTSRIKSRRIDRKKRSLSPDFVSSAMRPTKLKSFTNLPTKKAVRMERKAEKTAELVIMNESPLGQLESSSNSIEVDEEVSFKRDSYSSPLLDTDSCSASSSVTSSPFNSRRRGRRGQKCALDSSTSNSSVDLKLLRTPNTAEQTSLKAVLALRTRHSSIDSNKSDSSQTFKRHGDSVSQGNTKKVKKSDPLKVGLIKITPPSVQTTPEGSSPLSRLSEAASKTLNHINLRNRGINSLDASSVSSPSKNVTNQNSLNNATGSHTPGKASNTSHRISSIKVSSSTKSTKLLNDSCQPERAVVKRRNPSAPPIPSRKPRLKAGATCKGNGPVTPSTAVFIVDPVPQPLPLRSGLKSTSQGYLTGNKTIHTQLPPGTSLKSQNVSRYPALRIDKNIKKEKVKRQRKKI